MAFGDKMHEALSDQTASAAADPPISAARAKHDARLAARRRYKAKAKAKKAAARATQASETLDGGIYSATHANQDIQAAEALAESLIADLDDAPAAPPAAVTMTMDQVLQLMAASKGGGFDEAALTRVLTAVQQSHVKASADAMQTALNRSNANYVARSPFHYADGREAIPKYTVFFGPQFTNGKGAPLPRDLFSPDECDLINRFEPGMHKIARNGQWTANVIQNGSTQELVIKVPMTTMDQRQNLPSLTLILRELLEGELAVNPDTLAARVAELERKLAATAA